MSLKNIILINLSFVFILSCGNREVLFSSLREYPADGKSGGKIVLEKGIFNKDETFISQGGDTDSLYIISHEKNSDSEIIYFKSNGKPGKVFFNTNMGHSLKIDFYSIGIDIDNDGFPDRAELDKEPDRKAFREWFVRIAESQFLKVNYSWNKKERDCAGLIRFAYREALKKHDDAWYKESGTIVDKNLPDIEKYRFPDIPYIGGKIFKISEGKAGDIKSFGYFADAKTMINLNTFFISKNVQDSKKGDLLFYRDESNFESPYHSMIVCENEPGKKIILVYHTGTADRIKRVTVDYLNKTSRFRPVKGNSYFMGVYRFRILD